MTEIRTVVFFRGHFKDFYDRQSTKTKEKIDLSIYYLQYLPHIPSKHVGSTGQKNLFYLRVKQSNNIYRIFFCYDEGKVVILMNGFQKKSSRIPKNEILKALRIKSDYFNEKK